MRLDDNMLEDITNITFLHECIHIIDEIFAAGQLSDNLTSQISEGLYQILRGLGIRFVK